ncbi:hypothetical protein BV20DRAFT_1120096 [Pilatotrama ljubarskyi]|nr:hypothetical protein BV20DRAFT_1120096 [Pilatotrama ljubarskyi]
MDYNYQNSVLGVLATLRAARRQASESIARATAEGDSGGLVDVLRNPDFVPQRSGDSDMAGSDEVGRYDDLPALEEDAGPSTLRRPRAAERSSSPAIDSSERSDEDDLPALEAAPSPSSSRLSARDGSSPSRTSLSGDQATSLNAAQLSIPALGHSHAASESRALSRESSVTSPPLADSGPEEDEASAESDDSMPPLQTVSDSSEDSDSYFDSDPDWDDSEEYGSMADSNEYVPPVEIRPDPPPAPPSEPFLRRPTFFDLLPDVGLDLSSNREDAFQTYRDLLERARSVLPDISERFNQEVFETLAGYVDNNDPVRAETLLAGMEVVPDDLVRRYEKLRMADGEDGDGCAICRDDLLDKTLPAMDMAEAEVVTIYAALPFHPEPDLIVAFPCPGKHLFHSECLSPWLARKTTCPSCRFDIDPHSLTQKRIRDANRTPPNQRPCAWQAPQVESMRDWLDAEERARATGVSRERPEVVMPKYQAHSVLSVPLVSPTAGPSEGRPAVPVHLPPAASLADLLDSPSAEWNYDPETGSFDMAAAYRDIQEMRQRFLEAEAQRHRLENYLFQELLPAVERASPQVPPRPPSAPPVPPSEASPSMLASAGSPPPPQPLSMTFPAQFPASNDETPSRRAGPGLQASPLDRTRTTTAWDRFSRLEAMRIRLERSAFGDAGPPSPMAPIPPEIADRLSRQRDNDIVSMPMPPLSGAPEALEGYARLQRRVEAINRELRLAADTGVFPAVPAAFEDVVGGFAASVQAAPHPAGPEPTGPAITPYPGSGAQAANAPADPSPLTTPFFSDARVEYARLSWPETHRSGGTSTQASAAAANPSHAEPVYVRMSLPVGGPLLPQVATVVPPTPNAFDSAEAPPPIQADPNNSLQAVAPLVLDADYMHALLNTGLVDSAPNGEAPPPAGSSWADDLD